jgi:Amt family ammonium transporter
VVGLLVPLRVTEEQEHEGLDRSQHAETVGESALAALHSSAPASAS